MPPTPPEACVAPIAISVLIATHGRPRLLRRALSSLAAQTLSASAFEVVIVVNGEPGDAPEVVDDVRREHPELRVRLLECKRQGAAHARQIGLWAARGEYATILDDDDWLTPSFLEAMLTVAGPAVVPLAWLAESEWDGSDLPPDSDFGASDRDNYYSRALEKALASGAEAVDDLRTADRLSAAVSLTVCKLVPTALARQIRYEHDLVGGSDFVYWTAFFIRYPSLRFRIVRDRTAAYVRGKTPGSLSRRPASWEFSVMWRLGCIEALERLEPTTPDGNRLVQAMVDAQCRHLRGYLDANPAERARVVAEVQSRGLRRVRWDAINRDTATGLAILYAFAPWSSTSALVAARRVRERGEVVDVVCQDLGTLRHEDTGAGLISDPWTDRRFVLRGNAEFSAWRGVSRFSDGAFRALDRSGRAGSYSTLYSRAMWVASHIVAAQYKIRYPEVHWIAEMSDPLSRTILGKVRHRRMRDGVITAELRNGLVAAGFEPPTDRNVHEWAEHLVYALADEVVFTNELQRDYMLGYCADPEVARRARRLSRVSPHPTLDPHMYRIAPEAYDLGHDRVHLAYFGVFYATRGLGELTEALRSLDGPTRSRVRLHVFTNTPDEVRSAMHDSGLSDVVHVEGYRPFLGFLNLTTKFDVLVVNDAEAAEHHGGVNPYLPSKVSDYLGSGTPVWALYEPGSVLSGLEVAHRSPIGDAVTAGEVLRSLVRSRFGSGADGTGEDAGDALAGASVPEGRGGPHLGAIRRKDAGGGVGQ